MEKINEELREVIIKYYAICLERGCENCDFDKEVLDNGYNSYRICDLLDLIKDKSDLD